MLPQLTRLSSRLVAQQCRRHLAASAVVGQKAGNLDPIQKLFLDKITEFKQQSQYVFNHFSTGRFSKKILQTKFLIN